MGRDGGGGEHLGGSSGGDTDAGVDMDEDADADGMRLKANVGGVYGGGRLRVR